MNTATLGNLVAEQIEAIENDYGETGEIQAVCSIVQIQGPKGPETRIRSNCPGPPALLGLLTSAQAATLGMGRVA